MPNYSASAATGNDGTYRDNTYVDNYEGIGLAADNITVLDNTFDGNDAHVVLHSGDADLNAILAGNTFAGGGVIVDDSIVTQ